MRFHTGCHGNNIIFSKNNTVATRTQSYYHGITFSEKPHNIGELVTFLLADENKSWTGTIRFGLTNTDPDNIDSLPPFSMPDFASRSKTWMKQLSEQHNNVGSKIGLVFSNDGSMSLFVDGECKETCDLCGAVDVSEPAWLVIDVYGSITSVKLIPTETDSIPIEIMSHSIEAKKAYQQACATGTKTDYRTRLILVGQEGVGKTSLKKTLIGERFQSEEERTGVIDTSTVCVITSGDNWKSCGRDFGSENQTKEEYIHTVADYIVKKLTVQDDDNDETADKGCQDDAGAAIDSNQAQSEDSTNPGLHDDDTTIPDEVTEEVERLLREQRKAEQNLPTPERERILTAEEEEANAAYVNIWDFGGQKMYHFTQQVFLSSHAVYIVVVNLNNDFNQTHTSDQELTPLEYLDFCLTSIFIHTNPNEPKDKIPQQLSPPIFIVGTNRNSLDKDPQRRQKMVEEKFAQIRQHLKHKPYRQHIVDPFYAVENSLQDSQNDQATSYLRQHIYSVLKEEPYMGRNIPIRWLLFEDTIKKSHEKGIHYLTLEQTKELAHSVGMESDQDLLPLLHFYHNVGRIIYFGGENDEANQLKDLVILDPTWLVEMFKRVITVRDIREQSLDTTAAWMRLENEGILEDCLIHHMWSHMIEMKPALVELMIKFDVICPLMQDEDEKKRDVCYYVPSVMKPIGKANTHAASSEPGKATVFYIDFDGFMPDGFVHRLLAKTVSWCQSQGECQPSLHYRHAILYADDLHQLELRMSTPYHAKITVIINRVMEVETSAETNQETEIKPPMPSTCGKVKAFMSAALQQLTQTYAKPVNYSFHIDCPCGQGVPLHTIDLDQCLTKDALICKGRKRINTAGIKKQFEVPDSISDPSERSGSSPQLSRDSGDPSSIASSSLSSTASSFSSASSAAAYDNKVASVSTSDVTIIGEVGAGGFGVVFHATHKHWGDVAVKQLDYSSRLLSEAKQMWRTISSKYLVRIMGIIDDPNHASIVMEYFEHGSLKDFMMHMTDLEGTLPRRVRMMCDIAIGMNYLHTLPSPIVHRDLKCDNVFVGDGFTAKIGDLGLAVKIASISQTRNAAEKAGTLSHIPPEILKEEVMKPTTEWDVYSFGVTLYEILTNGKDPWPQLNTFCDITLLTRWVARGERPALDVIQETMPSDITNIMTQCWHGKPTKRPSFQELQIQLTEMYATNYEIDIYKADKLIMDAIAAKKYAAEEKSVTQEPLGTDEW